MREQTITRVHTRLSTLRLEIVGGIIWAGCNNTGSQVNGSYDYCHNLLDKHGAHLVFFACTDWTSI
jgi:hypothetical protein